jgi:ribosomal protein S18 acetylase RimI-like enzyme
MRIVDYQPAHAEAWRTLNEAWISRLFAIEAKDREVLDDLQGAILAKGGRIFMAEQDDGAVVGCVALIALPDGGYEVAKMTVAETLRGGGLGRRLMQACVDAGRAAGAPRLYLETNSGLGPALALYRSFGFRDVESAGSDYRRCDVWMELPLR